MKIVVVLLALCIALPAPAALAQAAAITAFVDVNVVPMDQNRVLPHQTVLVRGNSVAVVGPVSSTKIPADTQRVEGRGSAFLLPGLADMENVESLKSPVGVMSAGRWRSAKDLAEILDRQRAKYDALLK